MPRKKPISSTKPYLTQIIESGKPINGVKGFVRLSKGKEAVFVPAKIKGITAKGEEDGCGVSLLATPEGGCIGPDLPITPCQFFKDKADIVTTLEEEARTKNANDTFRRIANAHSVSHAKYLLYTLYEELPPASQFIVMSEAQNHGGDLEKKSTITGHSMVNAIARVAVQTKYALTDEQTENLSRY